MKGPNRDPPGQPFDCSLLREAAPPCHNEEKTLAIQCHTGVRRFILAQEGGLKALGWSPTNRPLARPVVSREEPPARPVGRRGKERARESAVKNSHCPTTSAALFVCEATR